MDSFLDEIESIKILLKELKLEQQKEFEMEIKNYKVLMQRINKLREYNEISELRYQYLYNELKTINEKLNVIY